MRLTLSPPRDRSSLLPPLPVSPAAAIVTASHAPDFERCRLLCETIDAYVTGAAQHLILVESRDVALFRSLEGPRRTVVDERDILPSWLHAVSDPISRRHRRVWLSWKTLPLRGWHVQQLRRIAVAAHTAEDHLVFCDSDVAFVRPFDCGAFAENGRTRVFRIDGGLGVSERPVQVAWWNNAGRALGVARSDRLFDNYVSTLIAWRREAVLGMCRRIEAATGRSWAAAVAADRKFSECLLYGRYVAEVLGGEGHNFSADGFCRVHWDGAPMTDVEFRAFLTGMAPEQVAVCLQSFIGTDLGRVRPLVMPVSGGQVRQAA